MRNKGVRNKGRNKGVRTLCSGLRSAVAVLLLLLVLPSPADSSGPPSLDEQLLDDAQLPEDTPADSLDPNVLRGLFPSNGPPVADDHQERLRRKIRSAILRDETNPLVGVARRMQLAERLIGRIDSGARTQEIQRDIVANLDELIEQARKQCGSCKPSPKRQEVESKGPSQQKSDKEPKPSPADPNAKPSSDGQAQPGSSSVERPDMGEMNSLAKSIWGELPEVARQQMLEPLVEEFLPKYELLIEQYYKRLAKQHGVAP